MIIFWLLLFLVLNTKPILASQNIFGLHLTQPSDINSASKVINSSGGDWGWATIVVRTDQLDHNTWQDFFDNCRKLHLIPIVRLATIMRDNSWQTPTFENIDKISSFLNSLNWPGTTQHIILFNEINHASEWGGKVNVKNYTDIAIYAAQKFKSLNPNFFVLGSAIDLASPENPDQFKSALNVYKEIYNYNPVYFDLVDGLASHSYPNHGFIGKPSDSGQHSVKGYQWELEYLKSLGIQKKYPVFITETGWPHREGETNDNKFYTVKTSAEFLETALNNWSKDQNIIAVTPFIFNYPYPPFDHFSWLDKSETIYPEYQNLISLPKSKNNFPQTTNYSVINMQLPLLLFSDKDYSGQIILKNTGQSIWGETQFCLNPQTTQNIILDIICTDNNYVYPNQNHTFNFKLKINSSVRNSGKTFISWDKLPQFEILAIDAKGSIFRPNTGLKDIILNFFTNLFI
jgi:hypothetical protein